MPANAVDAAELFGLHGKTVIVAGPGDCVSLAMITALASAGADVVHIRLPNHPNNEDIARRVRECGRQYTRYEDECRDEKRLRAVYQRLWEDSIGANVLLNCFYGGRNSKVVDFVGKPVGLVLKVCGRQITPTRVLCKEFAKRPLAKGEPGKIINVAKVLRVTFKAQREKWTHDEI